MFVIPFPAPATSHAACGFPALRVPAHFISRFMRLNMLAPLSATAGIAIGDATAASRSLGAVKRQDVSVFALTYSLGRRSCRSIGAFIISPLPPMLTKTTCAVRPLRSTGVTRLHHAQRSLPGPKVLRRRPADQFLHPALPQPVRRQS